MSYKDDIQITLNNLALIKAGSTSKQEIKVLDILTEMLTFAMNHLVKNGKLVAIGWRVWLYPKALSLIIKLVTQIVKIFKN